MAPVTDDRAAIAAAFDTALDADLVLISGGSSVGERDYILETIEGRGEVRFQGIAIKPGMPTIFGIVRGHPVFGMPGNPTSCLSNACCSWHRCSAGWRACRPVRKGAPRAARAADHLTSGTSPVLSRAPGRRRGAAGLQRIR